MGRNKRANIAALRQAKIYPPQQASAAADRPQIVDCGELKCSCSCRNPQAAAIHEMDHFSWIAAARELRQCRNRCGSAAI